MVERPKTSTGPGLGLVAHLDPKSAAAEAYRSLRTSIQFAGLDHKCRSIVVTSSSPGEGKSTTVANFGVVTAQTGARVCLVDSDLRRPTLHRLFGLGNSRGLTSALLEGLPFAEVAQSTSVPNLFVLSSGPLPPNPAELVGSNRMRECMETAASEFDMILLDSPPVVSVADAIALAAFADGVVMVVQAGKVPHDVVRRAMGQIEAVKGRILGVVMNSVNLKRDGYYYDYYRYYHSYYAVPDGKKR
ncbi:MAG TPA: CpsD/CapB family tyrosine-protein kinase [Methylomirabilota bacterium]|jgi:capsular exopolysaccharide synthesis family protein|nr:CpsD/CapB family tyrosine-protein kinase [Methylomirabilota bacterium]